MESSPRYSPRETKRKAILLCVKLKNSKKRVSKYRTQKGKAVIRVESEETQDHARKRFTYEDFSQEVNEIGFVPNAFSGPRGAIHWRDNQCSEHGVKFNQIGAMVTEEGVKW